MRPVFSAKPVDTLTSPVIAIPIRLLWKVKIRILQKIILGFSLCLSSVMCLVALVRVAGLLNGSFIDQTWEVFWLQMQACIAVLLVSLTAFRSFFVSSERQKPPKRAPPILGQASRRKPSNWGKQTEVRFPTQPSAALTGLQPFIRGGPRRESAGSTSDESIQLTSRGNGDLKIFPEASNSTAAGSRLFHTDGSQKQTSSDHHLQAESFV